jgi:hypothetical protein
MMIRLFGFVVGAALAVGAILLLLGVPRFAPQPLTGTLPEQHTQEIPEREPQVEPAPAPEPEPEVIVEVQAPQPAPAEPGPEVAPEMRWHSFWSPFGSQIAANGFVSRLEAVTGYDYRVVRIDTGVYEVAFAYTSDDERQQKLAAIASATGLEIPGS